MNKYTQSHRRQLQGLVNVVLMAIMGDSLSAKCISFVTLVCRLCVPHHVNTYLFLHTRNEVVISLWFR